MKTGIESALSIPVWAPLNLKMPKLRQGSHFPGFLEARMTSEKALVAVIQEAWIGGLDAAYLGPDRHTGACETLGPRHPVEPGACCAAAEVLAGIDALALLSGENVRSSDRPA